MKKSTEAALYSLLLFPGSGHLLLKRYFIGMSFIVSFIYLLWSLVSGLYDNTYAVVNNVISNNQPINFMSILTEIFDKHIATHPNLSIISLVAFFIWVLAAFDAHRIGKQQ